MFGFRSRAGFAPLAAGQTAGPVGSPFKGHDSKTCARIEGLCRMVWDDPEAGRAARDAYIAAVQRDLPAAVPGNTVLLSCDPAYLLRFSGNFIASKARAGDDTHLHIHLTLPDAEARSFLSHIQARQPEGFSFSECGSKLPTRLLHAGVFLTSARFILAPALMAHTQGACVILDVDGVVRQPLSKTVTRVLQGQDVALIRRKSRIKISRRVLASALVLAPTPGGLRFADALSRALVTVLAEGPLYHIDQTVLYYLYRIARRDGVAMVPMGLELADHHFRSGSAIWSAKGRKRKHDPRFVAASAQAAADFAAFTDQPLHQS